MRSHRVSVRVPGDLFDAVERLRHELGYKNLSAFTIGCYVLAVQNERRRTWVREISNAKPNQQDFALSKILGWPLDLNGLLKALKTLPGITPRKKL